MVVGGGPCGWTVATLWLTDECQVAAWIHADRLVFATTASSWAAHRQALINWVVDRAVTWNGSSAPLGATVTGDDMARGKPAPDPYLLATHHGTDALVAAKTLVALPDRQPSTGVDNPGDGSHIRSIRGRDQSVGVSQAMRKFAIMPMSSCSRLWQ